MSEGPDIAIEYKVLSIFILITLILLVCIGLVIHDKLKEKLIEGEFEVNDINLPFVFGFMFIVIAVLGLILGYIHGKDENKKQDQRIDTNKDPLKPGLIK